ncbi:MAG: Rrf2 family transcriptional regulator [Firmicutes bacterium]|nr:Rrf2 family transcriptional regulator [Bacillota bacterium]
MSYSTTLHTAVGILALISIKMKEYHYEFVSTKLISEHLKIPAPTVVKALKNLNAAGIIDTKEGARGGVLLAKPLSEITLLDIFLAVEPGKPLFKTISDYPLKGREVEIIKARLFNSLQNAEKAMMESLKTLTLEDLFNLDL